MAIGQMNKHINHLSMRKVFNAKKQNSSEMGVSQGMEKGIKKGMENGIKKGMSNYTASGTKSMPMGYDHD